MDKRKIAIVGGSVTDLGKTTFSKHLKAFLVADGHFATVRHVGVENSGKDLDGEDLRIEPKPDDVRELFKRMALLPKDSAIIVDVGGEHFKSLLRELNAFNNKVQAQFEAFIFPVTPAVKAENVVRGISDFIKDGVPAEKIHVVFNRIEGDNQADDINKIFKSVFDAAKVAGFNICQEPIYESELVAAIRGSGTVFERISDEDLQKQIDEAIEKGENKKAEKLADMMIDASMADVPAANYRSVFTQILS